MSAYDELVKQLGAAAVTWQETAHELLAQLNTSEAARQSAETKLEAVREALGSIKAKADLAADACDNEGRASGFRMIAEEARQALAALDTEKAGG